MKVTVIGANGKIGQQVVQLLQNNDQYTAKAMVRKEDQFEKWQNAGVDAVLADLEGSVEQLEEAIKGSDAVVFAAGSGSKTGPDKTMLVDMDGAIKAVQAAEAVGVDRFVMISAQHANNRDAWFEKIRHYYAAKHYADKALMESRLKYTIVRPGLLKDDAGTGKITVGDQLKTEEVSRADVAETVIAALDDDHAINKSFDLVKGETPIKEAISHL
jgi:uncharacterized protein YbjT (DUF2867 family)